jgi:hypothetical protein
VNRESAEPDVVALLDALGQVRAPDQRVLEQARDVLWSAVAGELIRPVGEGTSSEPGREDEADRRMARLRQAAQSQDEHKWTIGGC